VRERLIAQARLAAQTQPGAQWSSAENRAPDSSGAPAVAAVATDAGSALAAQNGGPEWRIVEFLVQGGWTQLLAKYDWRAPEAMGRAFPRLFGLCLDALNRGTPAEDRQLAAICRRVGERRILAAGGFLVENEGILDEPRLRRIVAVHDDAMLPLVRIIAERGPVSVRKFVAGRLRKRDLPVAELAALQGVYPASDLSNGYLIALCAMEPTAAERRWLIEESGRLLRRFLNESAGNEELTERRIFAINLLRVLPSQETLALLRTIRNENSRLALSRAKQALRKAASEAYDQMVDQV
jgi:hypothetical protein